MVRLVTAKERQQGYGAPAGETTASGAISSPCGYVGWVCGTCAPGWSVPVYSPHDGETIPEAFTWGAWCSVVEQLLDRSHPVRLLWQHGGLALARTDRGSLWFRAHRTLGLTFEARLPAYDLDAIVLRHLAKRGCPVSVGYRHPEQRIVEHPVRGRVRVLDSVVLDHVALLPLRSGVPPAYPAARAYGIRTPAESCPFTPRANAIRYSCVELARRRERGIPILDK